MKIINMSVAMTVDDDVNTEEIRHGVQAVLLWVLFNDVDGAEALSLGNVEENIKVSLPSTTVPADVVAAVERMYTPLHESRLTGVTAQEDARCMAVIKHFIDGLRVDDKPYSPTIASPVQFTL